MQGALNGVMLRARWRATWCLETYFSTFAPERALWGSKWVTRREGRISISMKISQKRARRSETTRLCERGREATGETNNYKQKPVSCVSYSSWRALRS
ncbi:hypothetical protein PENSPDRAFT_96151 [Peniophora sp. CONT]|nr:hypothetical protein PENSPDRAFT_96151 [Peniophora sp. CONT]